MGAAAVQNLEDVIAQMLQLQKALPPRPTLDEVEEAQDMISKLDSKLVSRLEKLFQQSRPESVPTRVFRAFLEMHEEVLRHETLAQKRTVMGVIELEERHRHYDSLIQKVHSALQPRASRGYNRLLSAGTVWEDDGPEPSDTFPCEEEKKRSPDILSGRPKSQFFSKEILLTEVKPVDDSGQEGKKEHSGSADGSPLSPRTDFAPSTPDIMPSRPMHSRGSPTLVRAVESGSALVLSPALSLSVSPAPLSPVHGAAFEPLSTIHEGVTGGNSSLKCFALVKAAAEKKVKRLDLHGALLEEKWWLPEAIGLLSSITVLDLSGNRLQMLPDSIGDLSRLTDLNVSSNELTSLPESLGHLRLLTRLNIENNSIVELPWTIGKCTALVELNADVNKLKALPEAVGDLGHLRHLSVPLNRLKSLPTTIASLTSLVVLDAHFNELESVPESLCSLTTLTRLDIASNFSELRALPPSIGKLQMLNDLDISNNQITVLPDSFALLTNLHTLRLEGNPWRVPPLHVAEQGKEAVICYMTDRAAKGRKLQIERKKKGMLLKFLSSVVACVSGAHQQKVEPSDLDFTA